jgi:hypothetical protein
VPQIARERRRRSQSSELVREIEISWVRVEVQVHSCSFTRTRGGGRMSERDARVDGRMS